MTLFQDLKYSFRSLSKSPSVVLVAVLALALGIGANTALFTVVNAVLLRPLPYPESERLMQLARYYPGFDVSSLSAAKFLFWQRENRTFDSMAAYDFVGSGLNLVGMGEPERFRSLRVTPDFFRVLRINPMMGRSFTAEE